MRLRNSRALPLVDRSLQMKGNPSDDPESSQLVEDIRACTLCRENLPLNPRPILQLDPRAKILVAGQAPGRKTHQSGIPFDDPSGDRLRDWMGIDRSVFYDPVRIAILPMGFCYPGTGKSGDLPPRKECADTWRTRALSSLPNIQLTLVIGKYALDYHLPEAAGTLTHIVQDWERYWPKILPLPHPSPRNNIWIKRNPWFPSEVLPVLRDRVQACL